MTNVKAALWRWAVHGVVAALVGYAVWSGNALATVAIGAAWGLWTLGVLEREETERLEEILAATYRELQKTRENRL